MRIATLSGRNRRGVVLVFAVLLLVPLIAFVALAIDLGLVAVAKTQSQNAADVAAMTGARTLNGDSTVSFNTGLATTNARNAGGNNYVLSGQLGAGNVAVELGRYYYDRTLSSPAFVAARPGPSTENWSLVRSTVSYSGRTYFARALGISGFNVSAVATAVHRPRDVSIVLDYSGSMNNESDLWNNEGYLGSANNTSNNLETVYPLFGHYSDTANCKLVDPLSDTRIGKCNVTIPYQGTPAMVNSYFSSSRGATGVAAFTSQADSYKDTPSGDNFLRKLSNNAAQPYAATVAEVFSGSMTRDTTWERDGYNRSGLGVATYNGYTIGPRYWGKTFFVWPPDPRPDRDWRRKVFLMGDTSDPCTDNSILFNAAGAMLQDPGTTNRDYRINYAGVLNWIKNSGANPFPSQLRAGRILFYSAIPDDVPASAYNHSNANSSLASNSSTQAQRDQRFWKEYIDFVFGVYRDVFGNIQAPGSPACAYGPDFSWGTPKISAKPAVPTASFQNRTVNKAGGYAYGATGNIVVTSMSTQPVAGDFVEFTTQPGFYYPITPVNATTFALANSYSLYGAVANGARVNFYHGPIPSYMAYDDNPRRPRHRFWFGPMTMVQFLSDIGYNPGTVSDISIYHAKIGVQAGLQDIRANHPNNAVTILPFSRPRFTGEPAEAGRFAQPLGALGGDYNTMIDRLWYPPNSSSTDVSMFTDDFFNTSRATYDYTGNTASNYGFMLTYNQLCDNAAARSAGLGGNGRKGSDRLIIFETDGMANVDVDGAATWNSGSYYYKIGPTDTIGQWSIASDQAVYNIVDRIVALDTDFTNGPGLAKARKPVTIHTLAYGPIFENTGTERTNATTLLQTISTKGGTRFPTSDTDAADGYKYIIGTADQRKDRLKNAITKIMGGGVSVSLIE